MKVFMTFLSLAILMITNAVRADEGETFKIRLNAREDYSQCINSYSSPCKKIAREKAEIKCQEIDNLLSAASVKYRPSENDVYNRNGRLQDSGDPVRCRGNLLCKTIVAITPQEYCAEFLCNGIVEYKCE